MKRKKRKTKTGSEVCMETRGIRKLTVPQEPLLWGPYYGTANGVAALE